MSTMKNINSEEAFMENDISGSLHRLDKFQDK